MKVAFYLKDRKRIDRGLADALAHGLDGKLRIVEEIGPGYDLACLVGVKSQDLFHDLTKRGHPFLYFDKGYNRKWPDWWRVAINGHHPTPYLMGMGRDSERAKKQGWRPKEWRTESAHIVIAGSSAKYHRMYGLADPNDYAASVVAQIRELSSRSILYRPKPSYRQARPIPGAEFVPNKPRVSIKDNLAGAHAMVTHGSNACFDALLAGVPAIVLGQGVTAPISSASLADIERPRMASMEERRQLLANLAHCQWSMSEFRSGEAWKSLLSTIRAITSGSMNTSTNGSVGRSA